MDAKDWFPQDCEIPDLDPRVLEQLKSLASITDVQSRDQFLEKIKTFIDSKDDTLTITGWKKENIFCYNDSNIFKKYFINYLIIIN